MLHPGYAAPASETSHVPAELVRNFFLPAARHPADSDGYQRYRGIRTILGQHCTAECRARLLCLLFSKSTGYRLFAVFAWTVSSVFSIVRNIYERELSDNMVDMDVNAAILGVFLNTTLQAAVHLVQDYEVNLRFVKNHTTIDCKELTWRSTGFLCNIAYQLTTAKTYVFADSVLWLGKVGAENIPKTHDFGPPREDSKTDERLAA